MISTINYDETYGKVVSLVEPKSFYSTESGYYNNFEVSEHDGCIKWIEDHINISWDKIPTEEWIKLFNTFSVYPRQTMDQVLIIYRFIRLQNERKKIIMHSI